MTAHASASTLSDRIAETHAGARTEFTLDVAAGLTQVLAEID